MTPFYIMSQIIKQIRLMSLHGKRGTWLSEHQNICVHSAVELPALFWRGKGLACVAHAEKKIMEEAKVLRPGVTLGPG